MILFKKVKDFDGKVKMPTKVDNGSAGYDFYLCEEVTIKPKETIVVPTNIKAQMPEDMVLLLYIRSSIGIKRKIALACGTGVIDSSYYENPNNDGNIQITLYNYGEETQTLKSGERVMQGVFVKYYNTTDYKPSKGKRQGGIGSSGK